MSSVKEIQDAISQLSNEDLSTFREWFTEFETGRSETVYPRPQPEKDDSQVKAEQAFIGMWADREDLANSTDWVRSIRKREWVNPIE